MKKIGIFVALVFLVTSVTLVMAGGPGMGGMMGPECEMDDSVFSTLNLTAEQTEKVRTLRESYLSDIMPLRTQLFNKRAELRLLWMQTKADGGKIKAKQQEIHNLKGQLQEKAIDYRLAFRGILTPEQLSKFIALGHSKGHGHHGRERRHYDKGMDSRTRWK